MRLDAFVVSVDPAASHVALDVVDDPRESARWSLMSLRPGDGYVGAVAVESRGAVLSAPQVDDTTVAGVAAQCIRWSLSRSADPDPDPDIEPDLNPDVKGNRRVT